MEKKIRKIAISFVANTGISRPNSGEKFSGNSTSLKVDPEGNSYISGQCIRRVLRTDMKAIYNRFDELVSDSEDTDINNIMVDVGADIFGGMSIADNKEEEVDVEESNEKKDKKSKATNIETKRTSPLYVSNAIALKETKMFRDLLLGFKRDNKKNTIANPELLSKNEFLFGFIISPDGVGVYPTFFEIKKRIMTGYAIRSISKEKQMERVLNLMDSIRTINSFADSARNLSSFQPNKIIISLGHRNPNRILDYWKVGEGSIERERIVKALEYDGANVFIGNDSDPNSMSVLEAFQSAAQHLMKTGIEDISINPDKPMSLEEYVSLSDKEREDMIKNFFFGKN